MICVVDYGVDNIGSVLNMIKRVGGQALPTGDARVVRRPMSLAVRRLS